MKITHENKEWEVSFAELQDGSLQFLYTCGTKQMTGADFEKMVNGNLEKKKKAHEYHELVYNGKVEASGTRTTCWLKKKELIKAGTHKKFKLEIK